VLSRKSLKNNGVVRGITPKKTALRWLLPDNPQGALAVKGRSYFSD